MAYVLKYYKEIEQHDGSIIRLEIHRDNSDGMAWIAREIGPVIQQLSLTIQGQQEDIDAPIVKTSLNMTFVDAPDHDEASAKKCGDWDEFYTNDSTKWKVLVKALKSPSTSFSTIWGGYITPDSFSEQLQYRGSVTFVARDNIGHMQDFPFDAEGDENGLISLRELVEGAWDKIQSPMELYWQSSLWLECDGVIAYNTRMNVTAFEGKSWYEAVEMALYAYGAVMRYVGGNEVVISSLRHLPHQGHVSIDALPHVSPMFQAYAQRELQPAARRIEEACEYDLEMAYSMPQVRSEDFVGGTQNYRCKIDGIDLGNGSFGTGEHDAPVWPIVNARGWSNPSSASLFFNPKGYEIGYFSERKGLSDAIYRQMYIAANNVDSRSVSFSKEITCSDLFIKITFGQPVGLNNSRKLEEQGVFNLASITYSVRLVQDGITNYLANDGRWQVGEQVLVKKYDASQPAFDFEQFVNLNDFSGSATLIFTIYKIKYLQTSYASLQQYGLYASIQNLSFTVPDTISLLEKNTVNTKYDDRNNVVITRSPEIGPAYNTVAIPGFIKNGIFYYDAGVIMPAKAWSWYGGQPQQMAVYNHLQLLCYHGRPNNLITGDIVEADMAKITAIYVWENKEHVLIAGTYNYLTGTIEGAVLRQFARYEDMWSDAAQVDAPATRSGSDVMAASASLPETEQSSSTNNESGNKASDAQPTYKHVTSVSISGAGEGGSGGGGGESGGGGEPIEITGSAYIDVIENQIILKVDELGGLGYTGNGLGITHIPDPDIIINSLGFTPNRSYVHEQTEASAEWVIEHNLGRYPAVTVLDSDGSEVHGDVRHDSENKVTVKFTVPFGGTATLN